MLDWLEVITPPRNSPLPSEFAYVWLAGEGSFLLSVFCFSWLFGKLRSLLRTK